MFFSSCGDAGSRFAPRAGLETRARVMMGEMTRKSLLRRMTECNAWVPTTGWTLKPSPCCHKYLISTLYHLFILSRTYTFTNDLPFLLASVFISGVSPLRAQNRCVLVHQFLLHDRKTKLLFSHSELTKCTTFTYNIACFNSWSHRSLEASQVAAILKLLIPLNYTWLMSDLQHELKVSDWCSHCSTRSYTESVHKDAFKTHPFPLHIYTWFIDSLVSQAHNLGFAGLWLLVTHFAWSII